jgi:hypothetical protein
MLYKSFIITISVFSFLFSETITAQKIISPAKTKTVTPVKRTIKEKEFTKLGLKAGANISVVYLARNTKDNNNVMGFCGGFVYEINDFVRTSGLYSHFKPLNIEPTWYDVKASTYELNLEVLAKFPNKKTLLYPFAGISYNTYKGFFTGQNDFLNLKEYYPANTTVKSNWLGVNLGTGLEHNFGVLGVFIDYRMRVGRQDKVLNIMDVCYTGGLKVRFPYGKIAKRLNHINDKYTWF